MNKKIKKGISLIVLVIEILATTVVIILNNTEVIGNVTDAVR